LSTAWCGLGRGVIAYGSASAADDVF